MTLINTDGMAFIGPGSEWFWTALSGIVLAVTFIAIYRQLAMARGAAAVEQVAAFEREWSSERMLRYKLEVWVALADGVDPAHMPDRAATVVGNYWDEIALLVRAGHLDRKVAWNNYGNTLQGWWAVLAPWARWWREYEGSPTTYEPFEWLVGELDRMDRRAGRVGPSYDEAYFARHLGRLISSAREALRVEQSLRTVIVASPEVMPATPPTTRAVAQD